MPVLIARGIECDSSRITIPVVVENNCTLIKCAALKIGTTEFSDPVKLIIVGMSVLITQKSLVSLKSPSQKYNLADNIVKFNRGYFCQPNIADT